MAAGRPYWSPYVAGIALGLIVAATYVLMGYGPGASGAFAHVAARLEDTLAPARVAGNTFVAGYLESGRLWAQWVVVEVIGIALGGLLGAWSAGRFVWRLEAGPRVAAGRRLLYAFVGGATVGFASRIAQGWSPACGSSRRRTSPSPASCGAATSARSRSSISSACRSGRSQPCWSS
jgi:hypothetical protein